MFILNLIMYHHQFKWYYKKYGTLPDIKKLIDNHGYIYIRITIRKHRLVSVIENALFYDQSISIFILSYQMDIKICEILLNFGH
jgi:hypothetical protein